MGCSGSKVDNLPLVSLCRERKEWIKAAADHRYDLASAHVTYFQALGDIGDTLQRFAEQELVISPSSPVLTIPSDEGKKSKNLNPSSSSTSLSHSISHNSPPQDSPLHFHSDSDSESGPDTDNVAVEGSPEPVTYSHYMRSSTAIPAVVYEEPLFSPRREVGWDDPYGTGGFFGFSMGSPPRNAYYGRPQSPVSTPHPPPPPPPPASSWDFLNPFDSVESFYPGGYYRGSFGMGSSVSSPDSNEVRQREGIPDLEDETSERESAAKKGVKKPEGDVGGTDEGGFSGAKPKKVDDVTQLTEEKEIKSSSEASGSRSNVTAEEEHSRKKEVSFGVNMPLSDNNDESSEQSSTTTVLTHSTRDIMEAVKEIRDQFQSVSDSGKEVLVMLEPGKLRYHRRNAIFKVFRILDSLAPLVLASSRPSSKRPRRTTTNALKIAKISHRNFERYIGMKSGNLSSTLEKLYAWEKKLYKEVKDEEKLRVIYEKKCKELKVLDDRGAESNKIDATQASIRKLVTKLRVSLKVVDAIATRIHKLRDEELQPQLTELIQGFITMWKSMLIFHQKQFQAIVESKTHNLVTNTGNDRGASLSATMELELEVLNWCSCFNKWISTQKACIESLNEWLLKCILYEPEETPDGVVPFSPGRIGAPPVFIICNDWYHVMERVSETEVTEAMHNFAASLHNLWEKQDEEQRQKLKANYLSKDLEKRVASLRREEIRMKQQSRQDASDKTAVSVNVKLGDHEMDLDSVKKRLDEEKAKHQETVKQVQVAASSSLQTGLIQIFEAMKNFTSETVNAYEGVRIQNEGGST